MELHQDITQLLEELAPPWRILAKFEEVYEDDPLDISVLFCFALFYSHEELLDLYGQHFQPYSKFKPLITAVQMENKNLQRFLKVTQFYGKVEVHPDERGYGVFDRSTGTMRMDRQTSALELVLLEDKLPMLLELLPHFKREKAALLAYTMSNVADICYNYMWTHENISVAPPCERLLAYVSTESGLTTHIQQLSMLHLWSEVTTQGKTSMLSTAKKATINEFLSSSQDRPTCYLDTGSRSLCVRYVRNTRPGHQTELNRASIIPQSPTPPPSEVIARVVVDIGMKFLRENCARTLDFVTNFVRSKISILENIVESEMPQDVFHNICLLNKLTTLVLQSTPIVHPSRLMNDLVENPRLSVEAMTIAALWEHHRILTIYRKDLLSVTRCAKLEYTCMYHKDRPLGVHHVISMMQHWQYEKYREETFIAKRDFETKRKEDPDDSVIKLRERVINCGLPRLYEPRSLLQLCRATLYHHQPNGSMPALAARADIPDKAKAYLSLGVQCL